MSVTVKYLQETFLPLGEEIRIVSPSGVVHPEYIEGAVNVLVSWGYKVSVGRSAKNIFGRYAGTDMERLDDLQLAVDDPKVKAILCSRGGYGLSRIIDKIDATKLSVYPKLLLGFSDVTFLHNLWANEGMVSVHSVMAKQLFELNAEVESIARLRKLLSGEMLEYQMQSHALNRSGKVVAPICGGNLSILFAARGTDFEPDYTGKIVFIEDIGEKSYHIDRMMQNLRVGGVFSKISGLLVGHFTDCADDAYSGDSVYQIIRDAVSEYDFPVAFGFPAGHEDVNLPLLFGREVEFVVE